MNRIELQSTLGHSQTMSWLQCITTSPGPIQTSAPEMFRALPCHVRLDVVAVRSIAGGRSIGSLLDARRSRPAATATGVIASNSSGSSADCPSGATRGHETAIVRAVRPVSDPI